MTLKIVGSKITKGPRIVQTSAFSVFLEPQNIKIRRILLTSVSNSSPVYALKNYSGNYKTNFYQTLSSLILLPQNSSLGDTELFLHVSFFGRHFLLNWIIRIKYFKVRVRFDYPLRRSDR